MAAPKIGFLCGSLREGSMNKKLEAALRKRAKAMGASTSIIDLAKFEMPLFTGNEAPPASTQKLINKMRSMDAVIVVSPEYNGCLPPLLKNAIDWTSTVSTAHIKGQVIGLAACTPGPMSGIMLMRQMQFIFTRLGGNVMPVQCGVGNYQDAFDAKGGLARARDIQVADTFLSLILDETAKNK